jgi:hypothetical protein
MAIATNSFGVLHRNDVYGYYLVRNKTKTEVLYEAYCRSKGIEPNYKNNRPVVGDPIDFLSFIEQKRSKKRFTRSSERSPRGGPNISSTTARPMPTGTFTLARP